MVDFIRPNTIWIKKRCYRVNTANNEYSSAYVEEDLYPEDDQTYQDELDCGISDIPIEQLKNGKYGTSLSVASMFYPYIIGSKGSTKRRIENETMTQIRIPSKGKIADIFIQGKDVKTVRAARLKLELLVEQARKRQPFTHFLSFPINSEQIQNGFLKFQEEVLSTCSDSRGVDQSLFQSPKKLHITLCVMVLADDRERHKVVDVIEQCTNDIRPKFELGAIEVEMKGIEYMNDDPKEVDVLYGKVHSSSFNLQEIADTYANSLIDAGLIQRQYDHVKLHVTLMNTLFRKDAEGTVEIEQGTKKERESFDARKILENFDDYYFGTCLISELHVSIRFTTSNSGYYNSSKIFKLNE